MQTQSPNGNGHIHDGHGTSAIPEDKKTELLENLEDDWQDDPENPRIGVSQRSGVAPLLYVSLYTFISPLASSIMAPGLPDIATKYNLTNRDDHSIDLSIFLISFGVAPLFLAPLSEMYGRRWILNIGNLVTIGFNIGLSAHISPAAHLPPTTGALLAFRFLAGITGSAPIACGGGVISDLFSERDRAAAMTIYSLGPLIGPVVGPIMGGFVTETVGIKYVFIIVAGAGGIASAGNLRPSYPTKKSQKAADPEKAALEHPVLVEQHSSKLHYLWINLSRPAILLFRSTVCFLLSLYMAFMYGIYYLMFTTFSSLFSDTYGFTTGTGGLTYLGLGIGFILATAVSAKTANELYNYLVKKNGGKGEPEMRIPALIFGSLFVPVGLFWYGWSAAAKIHWIMPIIGSGIFGFGMMCTFLPIQLYLVDTFTYAASLPFFLLGFAFPLFGQQMFDALGMGGGNSLLGGLAILLGIPL
ncbi:MFS domain-containing protein [Mycena sanguinolenta]|uniref:MFS domain-containing protein n=1 Tax=Mycena sanguinolenta TaxID=230812 RepID=A0A8H6X6Z6_9AGAR|nr:MFS domain-containing protein [Mycena sanguinolenta]